MDYYTQKIYLAQVDENDKPIGKVERWEAHEKGILHRAIHLAIFYQDSVILQQRKHPAFNGFFDLTIASHPLMEKEKLQDNLTAIYLTLKREMNLGKDDLVIQPKFLGKFYYQATNPYDDKLKEHEFNYVYLCEASHIPIPNYDYAYGISVVTKEDFKNNKNLISKLLTPWTIKALKRNLL